MASENNKKFCLIGHPLSHSMSQFIHTSLFKLRGLPFEYDVVDIDPQSFNQDIESVLKSYAGFNVTIPYKNQIIPHLSALSGKAGIYQSVNTVKVKDENLGYNTDCEGFLKSLESRKIPLAGKVLLLGSGGVARTFAFEAALAGCEVINVCVEDSLEISKEIGEEIKERVPELKFTTLLYREVEEWAKNGLAVDFIINATPLGMFPHVENAAVSEAVLKCGKILYDSIYNPRETKLMKMAGGLGLTVVGGMAMLVWQAEMAQRIWFGDKVNDDEIAKLIEATQIEMERKFQ